MSGRRLLTGALAVAALLGACGDDDDQITTPADPSVSAPQETDVIQLDADVPDQVEAGPITWTIEATNVTDDEATVTFPTAQSGDATLTDDDGNVVHRWSEGQLFAQRIEEVTFAAGETRTYDLEDDLSDVPPGTYHLVLELSITHPPEPFSTTVEVIEPGT